MCLISAFPSFAGIPVCFANSAVGLHICAKTVGIKRYKSVIMKKRRSMIKSKFYKREQRKKNYYQNVPCVLCDNKLSDLSKT